MARELKLQSLVIVASNFNPSIFRERWLLDRRVFSSDELDGENVFTPNFVQVHGDIGFMAAMDRIQFVAKPGIDGEELANRASLIVKALPETPFSAAGFNFHWHFKPEQDDLVTFVHDRFKPVVASKFGRGTSFGIQAIRNINGSRETTVMNRCDGEAGEFLEAKINYHFGLTGEDTGKSALDALANWKASYDTADNLCRSVLEEAV